MKVLAIGSDRSICNPQSVSADRQRAYGTKFESLSIIVFAHRALKLRPVALSESVHVYPTRSRSKLMYGLNALQIARKLGDIDVVTAQDPFEAGLIAWIIARLKRAALHVQLHTDPFAPEFALSRMNRLRLRMMRFVLRRADRIRVVSSRIQEGIVRENLSNSPVSVLPIFVDLSSFARASAGELAHRFAKFETRFLVVSRLEEEKNVSLAISSFAKSASEKDCLVIVGEGTLHAKLEREVSTLGIASRVFFEGEKNPKQYYALADIVLVPSRYEGYGLVIAESLAAKKPVIATDVGAARELGAIVTATTDFADAIRKWKSEGPFTATLQHYPYHSFEEYVEAYCADIASTKQKFHSSNDA